MHSSRPSAPGSPNRYSAKRMAKPINFYCNAPHARDVSVVGDFNGWAAGVNPMKRQLDGIWYAQIDLHHGHHHYLFSVDGKMVQDPRAQGVGRNAKGER